MIHRIRTGESDAAETRRFVDLFDAPKDWQYMVPVLEFLPELDGLGPHAANKQMTILVDSVKSIICRKRGELDRMINVSAESKAPRTADELTAEVRARVAKLLFGPRGEKGATLAMKRLLTSWVEMGYPEDALQDIIDKNDIRGKVISRDSLGLPAGLREWRSKSHKTIVKNRKMDVPRAPKSAAEAPSTEPASAEDFSSDDPLDAKQNNSHKTYNPGDPDSPPSSDNPSKSLLWDSTDSEGTKSKGRKRSPATKPSFWEFVSTHSPEYADDIGPIHRKPWGNNRVKRCSSLSGSSKVTDQGTIVVKGFNSPSPEESYAILKEIDMAAANFNLDLSTSEQELMINRQRETEEAPRRHLKARPNLNDCAIADTSSEREIIRPRSQPARKMQCGSSTEASSSPTLTGPSPPMDGEHAGAMTVSIEGVERETDVELVGETLKGGDSVDGEGFAAVETSRVAVSAPVANEVGGWGVEKGGERASV
ncbi:MAG: hypothetical protein Q9200_006672 [Gallowayella weberi]